jgi:phospholipid N-methyltransferase
MFTFFRSFLRHPKEVGAFFATGASYSKLACKQVDWARVKNIVELGAGNGSVTKYIVRNLSKGQQLFVFEIDPDLFKQLEKSIKHPQVILIHDTAVNLPMHLKKHGVTEVEVVFSEIPMVSLPKAVGDAIIQAVKKVMAPGALYLQIQYTLLSVKKLKKLFKSVETKFTLFNLPPAFLHICKEEIDVN